MVYLGFWKEIHEKAKREKRPLYVLAPMADVTDCAFRKMINKYGKPDVTWTEFVSADGLIRATPEGKAKLMRDLLFNVVDSADATVADSGKNGEVVNEHPIVAQLFSSHPEYMREACKLVAALGFDGVDINMGCPDKGIERQGCGSAMIKNPAKAQEIIRAAKEGAIRPDGTPIPVTVKTRLGYNKDELETWLPALLDAEPAVITLHARTRKEMSKVPARWERVKRAVEIRDEYFAKKEGEDKTLIFGNGDVLSIRDAYEKCTANNVDGAMLGRAIFGNPWLFKNVHEANADAIETYTAYEPSVQEKLEVMCEHTKEYEKRLGDIKSFAIMKKHYKAYVNGFDGAKELRTELMEKAENAEAVKGIAGKFLE